MLLLDTHTWIWTVDGDAKRIGRKARQLIARADARDAVRVSAASVFEVAALHTAGRLRLAAPLEAWVRGALGAAGIRVADLDAEVAIDAGAIPRDALPDPMDRLLVATARHLGATVLTSDRHILQYAKATNNVRAHDASA